MGHDLSDVVCDNKDTPQSSSWSEEGTDCAVQMCPRQQQYLQSCQEDVPPGIELESEGLDSGDIGWERVCRRYSLQDDVKPSMWMVILDK